MARWVTRVVEIFEKINSVNGVHEPHKGKHLNIMNCVVHAVIFCVLFQLQQETNEQPKTEEKAKGRWAIQTNHYTLECQNP